MNTITCLIIDDEVKLAKSLSFTLNQANINCLEAYDGASGFKLADNERPDIILLDVRLPDFSGLDVLKRIRTTLPETPVIMISAYGDTKDAVSAMKIGASDYLTKPFDVDELILLVRETISRKQLKSEVRYLREKNTLSQNLIGESQKMRVLSDVVNQVAHSKAKTILLLGETGVGKTMVAREIHNRNDNKDSPFVEINCSSLPEQLMEAELFGVVKGAYTGASTTRAGLVEIANKGTLFLDEIGELPLSLQAKLLTLLESWTYRPIGSPREKNADVRVIAATNRTLSESVEQGLFRKDLFFRLNVIPVDIPPLRDREEDIWLLANFFAATLSNREGSQPLTFSEDVRKIFNEYNWPGNIRELKNIIERLTILYPGELISDGQLPPDLWELSDSGNDTDTIKDALADAERDLVQRALRECHGRKGLAAEKLGISRHALKRRIQKLGIE
ncbi:MAG: sigma-54-dependent transcriptional regulator [Cellvibrionaceae bacterium]